MAMSGLLLVYWSTGPKYIGNILYIGKNINGSELVIPDFQGDTVPNEQGKRSTVAIYSWPPFLYSPLSTKCRTRQSFQTRLYESDS